MLSALQEKSAVMNPIEKRFCEIEENIVSRDPEVQELVTRITNKYFKLQAMIPEKCKLLLRELDDLMIKKAYVEAKIMYKQGLNDGMEVLEDEN
jgi:hypothetical protein